MNENLHQLKETFLQEWPLRRIQNMTLEEYTNLEKTSFCYWVEATTTDLGSIWGGSAYKFGIFKRRNLESTTSKDSLITDGEYSWAKKYGDTKEIAFQKIKTILLAIIENTQNNTIEQIDEIDLGDAYKWKIAFLYGDFNIINIFKNESLVEAAQSLGYTGTSKKFTDLYRFMLPLKQPEQDFFEFTADLWQQTSLANPTRYWLYAPGENASKWEEFYEKGIFAIGWDDLGNLSQYKSRNEIKNALVAAYGGEGDKKNQVSANDDFLNRINIGDIVIVKRGRSQLLGYGQVTSDYYFDENDGDFKNRRKVDWKLKGIWNVNHSLVLKTLTDITKYAAEDPNYSKYYEKLLAIMKGENYKQAYLDYLSTIYRENSGTKTSYVKAIEILSKLLNYNIFEVNDLLQLQELYDDLIKEQRNTEEKYFHPEAPSYGQNGFYSASIKTYVEFHNQLNKNTINYWVFQGNPKVFDFETALREEILTDWTVSAHKEKIKIGDKVILYIGGKSAGCYALAEITSEPYVKKYSADNHLWKDIDKNELKAGIKITHNLVSNPIYKSVIDSHESLKNLKVGSQGTNFSATKEEYETLENLSGLNFRDLNNETKTNQMALNSILYGPPGTGKTYNSINKAIEIINPTFDLKQDRKIVKSEYDRLVNEGQIVFTTFHQSMSYEDFIEGIKPKVEEDVNENKQVVYEIEDGIFKRLVENAKKVKTASKEIVENYTFDDAWNDLISEAEYNLENTTPLVLTIQTPNLGLKVVEISERGNIKLKPIYSEDAKEYTVSYSRAKKLQEAFPVLSVLKNIDKEFRGVIGGSNSTAYWSILNFINLKINQNQKVIQQENILPALPHVLIIDEINRGNVSQIFGELITIIEDSKRIGEEEALQVTLSYSKKKFGVPSNVYIIGTMNTADRSIEALDTALRRRFSFVEMMPDEKVIAEKNFTDYDRTTIMNVINQRIEVLLDRNYTLGHSYFIKVDFKNSFVNEIIPLLQEYFYNDYGKIGLVLGKGFVREKAITAKKDKSIFADFDTKSEVDIIKSYELIPFTEIDFDTAIQTLLA